MAKSAKKSGCLGAEDARIPGNGSFLVVLDRELRRVGLYMASDVLTSCMRGLAVTFAEDREVIDEPA